MSKTYEIPHVVTDYLTAISNIHITDYLTGKIPYSVELQCFWMAVQGCMKVREGANKDRQMNWFHSFCLSVLVGYGGGLLTPLWLGRPTAMISNDLCFGSCILAYLIVNCLPLDIGYKLCRTFPVVLLTTLFAELFRVCGIVNFCNAAYDAFKDKPSAYYPIPVFGPIFYASILGNMGPLFVSGFHSYLANGMPWGFQKGLFCSTFYHFYAHDTTGVIGTQLRAFVKSYVLTYTAAQQGMDDNVFPVVFISAFMHITAVLQLPELFGPSFSPFTIVSLPKWSISQKPSVEKKHSTAQQEQKPAHTTLLKQKLVKANDSALARSDVKQEKEAISSNDEPNAADAKKKRRKNKGGSMKED
jgi:hypothetical protein